MDGTVIRFDWVDDETCDIYASGRKVYTMGHGPHGWDGMTGIRDAVYAIAEEMGLDIVVVGEEAI